MTTIIQKLFSRMDSQRNRSTLVAGFSDGREPRRTYAARLWQMVVRKNPAHHVLVDFEAEGVRNLLGNSGAAEARIEALDLEDCGNQFL